MPAVTKPYDSPQYLVATNFATARTGAGELTAESIGNH